MSLDYKACGNHVFLRDFRNAMKQERAENSVEFYGAFLKKS